jgi:hypothetical protein
LIVFKTTTNFSPDEQQAADYRMLSKSKSDLVLVNVINEGLLQSND